MPSGPEKVDPVVRVSAVTALLAELHRRDPSMSTAVPLIVLSLAAEPARSTVTLANRLGLPYYSTCRAVVRHTFHWDKKAGEVVGPRAGLPLIVRTGPAGNRGRTLRLSRTAWDLLEAVGCVQQRPADADQEDTPDAAA
jgi:hypothetical protein